MKNTLSSRSIGLSMGLAVGLGLIAAAAIPAVSFAATTVGVGAAWACDAIYEQGLADANWKVGDPYPDFSSFRGATFVPTLTFILPDQPRTESSFTPGRAISGYYVANTEGPLNLPGKVFCSSEISHGNPTGYVEFNATIFTESIPTTEGEKNADVTFTGTLFTPGSVVKVCQIACRAVCIKYCAGIGYDCRDQCQPVCLDDCQLE
jgi:hypothetical protein